MVQDDRVMFEFGLVKLVKMDINGRRTDHSTAIVAIT